MNFRLAEGKVLVKASLGKRELYIIDLQVRPVTRQNFIVANNLVCRFDRLPARVVKGEVCIDTAGI
jgi:hypothetical protein